jgi:predicted Zn-dependent peptidase
LHLVVGRLDPARAAPALAEIRRAVSRWQPEATRDGFGAAKRAVVARLSGDIDDAGALAGALIELALDGRRPGDWRSLLDEVARVTPEDVAALGEAELAPSRATLLLRGPRDAIAKLGW